ncbi:hypothetical protein [Nocardia blacklockiae]|uniref:hypothetical protein n=1 Tax=Nocardia blacklockiae TaxID=480036 RepID=UPI0018941194|nr:hypothetical protein [Nocardia blacklockiae]MBF6175655.1 hypothetical protein [Nocardia blacklockiae]
MLDMDEPDEVVAASSKFKVAMTAVADHVDAVAGGLELPRRPESPLDQGLAVVHRWIPKTLLAGSGGIVSHADTTHRQATDTATVLASADVDGGTRVRRADPV